MKGDGINRITVAICTRCGRGFINEFAKTASVDTQPVWWTQDANGPMCNGQVIHYDRVQQIKKVQNDEQETAD